MRVGFWLSFTLATVACAEDSTSVVLNVRSDAGVKLQVRVCDDEGTRVLERSFEVSGSSTRRILLTPRSEDPTRRFYASLQLVDSSRLLARRRILGSYVANARVELDFALADECPSGACSQDYECMDGQCEVTVESSFAEGFPAACLYPPTTTPEQSIPRRPCNEIDDPDLLFCNDFAAGIGADWAKSEESGATVTWVDEGAEKYLRSTIVSQGSAGFVALAGVDELNDAPEFYVRVRFRVSSLNYNYYKPLRILAEDSRGRYEIGATVHGQTSGLTGTGPFFFFADENTDGATVAGPTVDEWTCLQMHVVHGSPGSVSIALDGGGSQPEGVPDKPDQGYRGLRVGAGFVSGGVGVFEVDDFATALRPLSCNP